MLKVCVVEKRDEGEVRYDDTVSIEVEAAVVCWCRRRTEIVCVALLLVVARKTRSSRVRRHERGRGQLQANAHVLGATARSKFEMLIVSIEMPI